MTLGQHPNHCVWLGLRRVFQTLQASLFNGLDLLTQDGQSGEVAPDFINYWLRVSDVAGLASATDQAETQELPGRGDDFESELGILSFGGRTELRRDLRRHNSAPNACFTLTEVA
jgi:hypothetical protein